MMNLTEIGNVIRRNAKEHSPLILSCIAGAGTVVTAYLAGKASFEAARIIDWHEETQGVPENDVERLRERVKVVWKLYIPTAISGGSTIACIIGANRLGVRKTIAAQTALTLSQQLYSDYRDKVIEEIGVKKEELIRGKIAEDRIKLNPPPSADVLVSPTGEVLCYEEFTGRYFNCTMEKLKQAQNEVNNRALGHDYCTLSDFYYMIGLKQTSISSEVGWKSGKLMSLEFSTVLTDDGRPCLAFTYNYTTSL